MGCSTSKGVVASPKAEQNFYSDYKLGKKLGEGAFGQVRLATERATSVEFAVKIVDVRDRDDNGMCTGHVNKSRDKVTKAEISLWNKASSSKNQHVVQLHCSFAEKSLYYMVCEKCQCSFMDRLVEAETMSDTDLSKIFNHMLRGVIHVHAMEIVHRDIKPDNFLWGGPNNEILKLCDFGLAVQMPKQGKLTGVFGTAPYMAPEMLRGDGYDFLVDVWSVGAVAYLMVFGNFPYSPPEASAPAMKEAILHDSPPLEFPETGTAQGVVSGSLKKAVTFTKALLSRSVSQRLSAAEAIKDPFVAERSGQQVSPVKESAAAEPAEEAVAENLRANVRKAKKLTQKLSAKPSPTVQTGIEDLLKILIVKTGGDRSSSNLFFSEGDNQDQEAEEENQPMAADVRIKSQGSMRRAARTMTHSGVVSEMKSPSSGQSDDLITPSISFTAPLVSLGPAPKRRPSSGGKSDSEEQLRSTQGAQV
ncbi:unnamed protein product [Polarella glacialis]|uniref:Protein kinase domain-containing protein n=1 Tax=Polarella glacialis TaxID=89957 RepID=A0A813JPZ0_POLGL|nr:unnamed protein product [Polarella glacialis]CAE8682285.1 unnamed protein product [Polarella glacialis]